MATRTSSGNKPFKTAARRKQDDETAKPPNFEADGGWRNVTAGSKFDEQKPFRPGREAKAELKAKTSGLNAREAAKNQAATGRKPFSQPR